MDIIRQGTCKTQNRQTGGFLVKWRNMNDQTMTNKTSGSIFKKIVIFSLIIIGVLIIASIIYEYTLTVSSSRDIQTMVLLAKIDSKIPSILVIFSFLALIPFVPKKLLLIPIGLSIWFFEGLKGGCSTGAAFICFIEEALAIFLFSFFLFSVRKRPIIYLILLPYILSIIFGVFSREPEWVRKSFLSNEEKITNEALETRNVKKCSEIRPLLFLPQSVSSFLFPNLIVYTPTYPHVYRHHSTAMGYCITKVAILEKNESICEIIKNLSSFYHDLRGVGMFDICINNVAIARNDISICKLTEHKEGTFHDEQDCVSKITLLSALSKNDISLCDKANQKHCYSLMAIFNNNKTLCEKVSNPYYNPCNDLKRDPKYFCGEFLEYDWFVENPSVIQFYNECLEKSKQFQL
jgi:hypothetical protein